MQIELHSLARALGGLVSNGEVHCPGPNHSKTDRSLSVRPDANAPDGFVVHCFSPKDDPIRCRDYVREKLNLPAFKPNGRGRHTPGDALRAAVMAAGGEQPRGGGGKIVAIYNYTDADGELLYQVLRLDEPKDFRQRRPDGNGGWIWKLEERRVLYRWPELLKFPDATIFFCEGEKDADNVAALDLCATTVAAGKWTADCVAALVERDVIILEDNDDAGRAKALAAAQALHGTAKTIRIVSLPGLAEKEDVSDWLDADPNNAKKFVDVCFDVPEWTPTNATTEARGWKFHSGQTPQSPRYLIKKILPETGAALMPGQWGAFKTTVALDASVSVMNDLPFAGHYQVKRRGGVLYFALEGEGMLQARLAAIAQHRGVTGALPFAWRGDCPPLMDKNAANILCQLTDEAAADIERKFSLPVVLIWVDTLITAAGYESGEDNDTAAAQKVMTTLRTLSQRTGTLVVGIDHFGKVVDTGTRGSSAKEGAADAILALLADRELSGGVKNTRLAVRKQRDGVSGFEIPFTPRMVETGVDDDGDPITAPVINWAAQQATAKQSDARWTPSMQMLRRVLMRMLVDGKDIKPFPDGPTMRACDVEVVRAEFYRQYPADGTDKQKADARRKAFNRSFKGSQAGGLVGSREVDGIQLIWLAKEEATSV